MQHHMDVELEIGPQAAAAVTTTQSPASSGQGTSSSGTTRSGSVYRHLSGAPLVVDGQHSVVTLADEQPCCRICLDAVADDEFTDGKAIKLGCRCSSHMDVAHAHCAERWFKLRRDTVCEICGGDAVGLPEGVRAAVRQLAAQAAEQQAALQALPAGFVLLPGTAAAASGGLHLLLPQWQGLPPPPLQYVLLYLLFCLLPTCVAAAALVVWYMYLQVDMQLTVVLSILASCASMVHWLMHPRRCLMHLVLVNLMVGCIVAACWVMDRSATGGHTSATINVLAVAGTLIGAAIGMTLFFCIVIPGTALLQTWLRQAWHRHSTAHGHGSTHSSGGLLFPTSAVQNHHNLGSFTNAAAAEAGPGTTRWGAAEQYDVDSSQSIGFMPTAAGTEWVVAATADAGSPDVGVPTPVGGSMPAVRPHGEDERAVELSVGAMWWAHA